MNLDLRTMMVMIAVLCLLLSGLLALAGLHVGNVRGVRHWAFANLCISAGLSFSILQLAPGGSGWVVAGATLIAVGMGLQLAGLRAFNEEKCDWRLPAAITAVVFVQTAWFVFIQPDVNARSIANSLIFALVNAAGAKRLLKPMKAPLRTAYWLTGASFAMVAVVFVVRAVVIAFSADQSYSLYAQIPLNPATFFIGSLTQLCLTFGFVLMLNYRLANDLHELATHDSLTGAFNRRSLESEAERMLAHNLRTGDVLAVMMIDVDHFKSINDQFGHVAGDEVLRCLASIARTSIRTDDFFARYGGEEFCILLPSTTAEARSEETRLNSSHSRASRMPSSA